jgi:hypothetical protein
MSNPAPAIAPGSVRAEAPEVPTKPRLAFDGSDEPRARNEIVLTSIRLAGVAFPVGAIR